MNTSALANPPLRPSAPAETAMSLIRAAWPQRHGEIKLAGLMAQRALELALAEGDERSQVHAELLLTTCAMMGEIKSREEIEASFQQHREDFTRLGDRDGFLLASAQRGIQHLRLGMTEAGWAELAPLEPEVAHMQDAMLRFLTAYGFMYYQSMLGAVDSVIRGYFTLNELARRMDQPMLRAIALTGLSTTLVETGDPQSALPYTQQVMELVTEHNINGMMGLCAANLAECLLLLGDNEGAVRVLAPELPKLEETYKGHQNFMLMIAAQAYAGIGDAARADALLAEAAARSTEELRQQLYGRLITGLIAKGRGQSEQAQSALAEAEALLDHTAPGDVFYAIQIYLARARLFEAAGDWRQTARYLELHRTTYERGQVSAAKARVLSTQVQSELEAERLLAAHTDRLTGLANWERLRQLGDEWLLNADARPAVLMLNVQRFKAVNDALGRDHGDSVLQAVAARLQEIASPAGHAVQVGRLHADRFCILWPDSASLNVLAKLLDTSFAAPLEAAGVPIDIAFSIGCAQATRDGRSMVQLLANAEIALHVDSQRKIGWIDYEPAFKPAQRTELVLLSELRRATEHDELRVFLQPKVRLRDGAIVSAEALVRWQHPQRGMLPPAAFIPFAEQTGNIGRLTTWMLRAVMKLTAQWRSEGRPLQVSVNAATADLRDSGFVDQVCALAAETGADPADIRIEITESGVMDDPVATMETLHRLCAAGFSLAIDDFGTGQSSLAYLQKMPVAELKIDRAFIANVKPQTDAANLLQATIAFGKAMGLVVVAEGAETAREWVLLECLGCDYAQGWYAAKPMPVEDFLKWKSENEPFRSSDE